MNLSVGGESQVDPGEMESKRGGQVDTGFSHGFGNLEGFEFRFFSHLVRAALNRTVGNDFRGDGLPADYVHSNIKPIHTCLELHRTVSNRLQSFFIFGS